MASPALSPDQRTALLSAAEAAALHAYAPYSHFYVGASVLLESGHTVTGCNVENASYRLTTCAEQTAIASAVAQHGPTIRIRAIAVANRAPDGVQVACQPCGACRQTILEFASPETLILFPGPGGAPTHCTLAELLPAAFTQSSLTPKAP